MACGEFGDACGEFESVMVNLETVINPTNAVTRLFF